MNEQWLAVLRKECERTTQAAVARALGVSSAMINQVLKGSYRGDMDRIQGLTEGAYMGAMVDCPVIGEIPRDRCIDHQSRAKRFAATNPMRVQLHRTCPECPNRGGRK